MENTRAKIEIRDKRTGSWVWTDKVLLYSPHVSATAYKVYSGLAAHADNTDQKAWPSIETLANRLNMGRSSVQRGLNDLERLHTILVERRAGMSSMYTLVDIDPEELGKIPVEKKAKQESPYFAFMDFWSETSQRLRKVTPVHTKADQSMLGRTLQKNLLSQEQLEQLSIYFLGSRRFLKFGPSMRTFFSAGIITGLMNDMQNNENFWKELDNILTKYGRAPIAEKQRGDMLEAMKELSRKMSVVSEPIEN